MSNPVRKKLLRGSLGRQDLRGSMIPRCLLSFFMTRKDRGRKVKLLFFFFLFFALSIFPLRVIFVAWRTLRMLRMLRTVIIPVQAVQEGLARACMRVVQVQYGASLTWQLFL